MAKNNLFLGTSSGSVGDVTLMRRNGKQVSRVRVRDVKNPKSAGQASQRSVFSPVAKFYSPLAGALEQSFEGKSKADSYTEFLRRNINLAKANDWNNVKGAAFWPYPYQLSQGTLAPLEQSFYTATAANDMNHFSVIALADAYADAGDGATLGAVSKALQSFGLDIKENDQFTLILVQLRDGVAIPYYSRFFVDTTSSVDFVQATSVGPFVFNITSRSFESQSIVAGACILSRYENGKWRRSTNSLLVSSVLMEGITLKFQESVESYMGSAVAVPVSPVYLNGSTRGAAGVPAFYLNGQAVYPTGGGIRSNVLTPVGGSTATLSALVLSANGQSCVLRDNNRKYGRFGYYWNGSNWIASEDTLTGVSVLTTFAEISAEGQEEFDAFTAQFEYLSQWGGTLGTYLANV